MGVTGPTNPAPDTYPLWADVAPGHLLTSGESTLSREFAGAASASAGSSGDLNLTYFTARKTEPITKLRMITGATPHTLATLVRWGVYAVAGTGDLTLLAAIANDTTIFQTASTEYLKDLTATFNKVRGMRYAVGDLVTISGGAMPTILGPAAAVGIFATEMARDPRMVGLFAGQTDLPATVAVGSITNASTRRHYAALVP